MDDQQRIANISPQISPPATETKPKTSTPQESKQELREAIKGSGQVLARATTVFMLFPDTITVDRAKLTITRRSFFSSAEVMSIRIEDVLNVTATVGPFFGSIKIVSRVMNGEQPFTINRFSRKDAVRLKHITQGYIIALQRNIDCSSLPANELAAMLNELGKDDHATV